MTEALLPRLLLGIGERPMAELRSHLEMHGPLPDLRRVTPGESIESVDRAGLRGHGGAAFPTAKKMRAVAARHKPKFVVANGAEGEPASKKDRVLLRELPHLVLDGAAVAAHAVGAADAIIALPQGDERSLHSLELALRERQASGLRHDPRFAVCETPRRYLAGQESALINYLAGGPGRPEFDARPYERGVRGRPTLVQNVETLAHMALIARHGADWFRRLGTATDPGSALVTISGAVTAPGVYEIEHGMPLSELLYTAGVHDELSAILLGGYFGSWVPAEHVPRLDLSADELKPYDATLGAGVIVALGSGACPVAETSRVADYFAAQSAGQCGPCVNGLAAIADTIQRLASGTVARGARHDLERWMSEVRGRGACRHPDGAVRFIASALRTFPEQFADHAQNGPCQQCADSALLPAPLVASGVAV